MWTNNPTENSRDLVDLAFPPTSQTPESIPNHPFIHRYPKQIMSRPRHQMRTITPAENGLDLVDLAFFPNIAMPAN